MPRNASRHTPGDQLFRKNRPECNGEAGARSSGAIVAIYFLKSVPFVLGLALLFAWPSPVFGEDGRFGLRLWGGALPFASGQAGRGAGAPGYDQAFHTGAGAGAEISWRLIPRLTVLAGVGYENYRGGTHQGFSFDDRTALPVYLGGKLHLTPESRRWDPYLRVDGGVARLSAVDVSFMGMKGRYWDASWVLLFDAGAGIEYRWNRWGASIEIRARYTGTPDSAMGWPSNADSSWTVPVIFGIGYYF